MDFLDKLVLPQSAHHMELLKYLLVLTYLIFIPYLGLLIGSNILSIYYKKKSASVSDKSMYYFAKELADLVTFNKSIVLGFGVVPVLSAMFCYAQLLHMSQVNLSGYLLGTLIFFVLGAYFFYTYKNSFHFMDILNAASGNESESKNLAEDISGYKNKTSIAFNKFGRYSLILFLLSAYLFIGAVKLGGDSTRWESGSSLLNILFSLTTLTNFLYFLILSLFTTSTVILYNYFRPNSEISKYAVGTSDLLKKHSLAIGIITSLLLPLLLLINTLLLPKVALNNGIFLLLIVAIFIIILMANFYYLMLKNNSTQYVTSVLFLLIVFFVSVTVKDQLAFDTSSQLQFIKLVKNYDEYQVKLKEELGLSVQTISGADIFNGRCIACHQFETKVVGPPYKETLPKYEGKRADLIKFILNPVKINPEYPVMPSQGLKPKEAEAVADYIIKTYEEKYK